MRGEAFVLVMLAALLQAGATLLFRGGVLNGGGLSLDSSFILQLSRLATQPLFLSGTILYAAAALVWFATFSLADLSVSYPILVAATFILVALGALFFFQEVISTVKVLGMIVIVVGIALVALAS